MVNLGYQEWRTINQKIYHTIYITYMYVSLVNQRNLIFPWLFKSQAVPSRLTSNINHLIFYRHLGVLSLFRICGEFSQNCTFYYYRGIFQNRVSKICTPFSRQAEIRGNSNLARITFSKIDSLSVKIEVGRENCYKSRYVIELAHLI